MSVIEPAPHSEQYDLPSSDWYVLAGHAAHVDELSAAAYLPAPQSVHDVTFDAVEYLPAAHAAQVLAPEEAPVFVFDPAAHTLQSLAASSSWNNPAGQAEQLRLANLG